MAQAVVFPSYISDGPGYAGRVEVVFDGGGVQLMLNGQDAKGPVRPQGMSLPVVGWKPATEQDAKAIWPFCDKATREWLEAPEFIPPERLAWLTLEDGGIGAVLLGGEPNLMTIFDLRKQAGEGACVAVEV